MTTVAPIDVEDAEAAVLVDFENIRISWEKAYGRVFRYTDICWLCELAEHKFKTAIGRIVVFMSDPLECVGSAHPDSIREMKRTLKCLKEDQMRKRAGKTGATVIAHSSNIKEKSIPHRLSNKRVYSTVLPNKRNSISSKLLDKAFEPPLKRSRVSDPPDSKPATEAGPSDIVILDCDSDDDPTPCPSISDTPNLQQSAEEDTSVCCSSSSEERVSTPSDTDSGSEVCEAVEPEEVSISEDEPDDEDIIEVQNNCPVIKSNIPKSFCNREGNKKASSIPYPAAPVTPAVIPPAVPAVIPPALPSAVPGVIPAALSAASSLSSDSHQDEEDDDPFVRLGCGVCPKADVAVRVFGYKLSGRRRIQRCCDVAIGNEVTKICFMARFNAIFLFSADSDFEETATSCATAEQFGGVIKYAKKINILGFSHAFELNTLAMARKQFRERKLKGRKCEDGENADVRVYLIDYEFPIIRRILMSSERPLIYVPPSVRTGRSSDPYKYNELQSCDLNYNVSKPCSMNDDAIDNSNQLLSSVVSESTLPSNNVLNLSSESSAPSLLPRGIPPWRATGESSYSLKTQNRQCKNVKKNNKPEILNKGNKNNRTKAIEFKIVEEKQQQPWRTLKVPYQNGMTEFFNSHTCLRQTVGL